ncbi:alpha-mannosidase [Mahella australiensis]|uniref:Glycoside hydrolase family 38 n=1 Tax=Mahella australiensis (strain DSM 15567 / CIP 107919 / 50-1 BON) TaxID=697281 RepID=F4A260_MAHA5|nr:alpha-mannosidase [Mahella australiensis]AEE97199.1 glycoside hydrolase family 38 [Mahella australiensis 50-1 BON]
MEHRDITVHMIGNAHIDPVWLWRWQEGFQAAWSTFRSALDRMNETPDFIFTCAQAAVYKWIEQADPDMFEEIKQRVKEGRWQVVGGWWMQPDCNIPSGESFVRQALYAQRYFKEKLGVMASTGYNVDSFGHNAMLPQILKKSGMDNYVFMRPGPHENPGLPDVFWWQSADGSRVLTYRIPFSYNVGSTHMEEMAKRIADMAPEGINDMMEFYGVGNHGGGPTKENIALIKRMTADPNMPRVVFSSPDQYFETIRAYEPTLPTVIDDLQHHASGCYSVNAWVKAMNRRCEQLLTTAEKFSLIAHTMFNTPYPQRELTEAWHNVLFNQFHDTMAGSSIKEAYEDARDFFGESLKLADESLNYAVNSIIRHINTEGEGIPLIAFNPLSWERHAPIEFEMQGTKFEDDIPKAVITDADGKDIPLQFIKTSATVGNGRLRITFTDKLPPMGYKLYRVFLGKEAQDSEPVAITKDNIENRYYRMEIDAGTGWIKRLYDKTNGKEVFNGPAALPVVIYDPSDTWSHGVFRFKDEIGRFTDAETKVIEQGPVRSRLRVKSRYGDSILTQDFIMYDELDYIECRVKVDWHEKHKMLKISFPVNVEGPQATYEIPYGYIQRPADGEEEPGQQWIDVTDRQQDYGLAIATDSLYSYDIEGNDMRITVLRSPVYAQHDPHKPNPEEEYEYTDQGVYEFRYILYPHRGNWQQSQAVKYAHELNAPIPWVVDTWHEGTQPGVQDFISIDAENIEATVMKLGEDKDAIIVRCYETAEKETDAVIKLPAFDREWAAHFGACEIKTFKIPLNSHEKIIETNMLEL